MENKLCIKRRNINEKYFVKATQKLFVTKMRKKQMTQIKFQRTLLKI